METYLQRIQKHGSTMAESALPPATKTDAAKDAPARIGTSNDTSWAGWAISSFTNKAAAAKGEIQPTTNGKQAATAGDTLRPSSVPLPASTSASTAKAGTEMLQPGASTPGSERPSSEQASFEAEAEADDVLEAWGTMDDDDDTFFEATNSSGKENSNGTFGAGTATTTSTPSASVPYDDGGEPDFAGWLAAQSQAKIKPKKPLPKGLGKATSTTSKDAASRPKSNLRSTTTGSLGTNKAKTPAKATKTIDTKPKDDSFDDDGWGDAWD